MQVRIVHMGGYVVSERSRPISTQFKGRAVDEGAVRKNGLVAVARRDSRHRDYVGADWRAALDSTTKCKNSIFAAKLDGLNDISAGSVGWRVTLVAQRVHDMRNKLGTLDGLANNARCLEKPLI